MTVGCTPWGLTRGDGFKGFLDQISIFDYSLLEQQVKELMREVDEGKSSTTQQEDNTDSQEVGSETSTMIILATVIPLGTLFFIVVGLSVAVCFLWQRKSKYIQGNTFGKRVNQFLFHGNDIELEMRRAKEWEIDYAELEIREELGSGSFGVVFRAR